MRKFSQKIGEVEEGNILFHYATGKNRTFAVAALIFAFFGTSAEKISLDCALTCIGTEAHRKRLLHGVLKWVGEKDLKQPEPEDLSSAKE